MPKEIFIIHPSEIIRHGLQVLLRKYFNIEITLLSHIDELKSFNPLKPANRIIIAKLNDENEVSTRLTNQTEYTVDIIQIIDSGENHQLVEDVAGTISTDSTGNEICELVSDLLKDNQNDDSRQEEGSDLTAREVDVLRTVALGFSNKEIADKLFISIHTVITHRKNITEKLGIKSISGLTVYSILNKIIDTDQINPEDLI